MLLRQNLGCEMPEISIIVPVYNIDRYLSRCIDSILKQSLKDFELILVDDGSTDQSGNICDNYGQKDKRIKVLHKINGGVSSARNLGLNEARGNYIGFVDGDDWIESDMYEILISSMKKAGADICVGLYIKDCINFSEVDFSKQTEKMWSSQKALENMLKRELFSWELCDKVYKKDLLKDILFNEKISNGEDLLINWELFNKASVVYYKPISKYHYCIRENSACTAEFSDKQLTYLNVVEKIYLESRNSSDNIKKAASETYISAVVSFNLKMLLSNTEKYKDIIQFYQKKIRSNFFKFFFLKKISVRRRMGLIFFLLPYKWCRKFNALTKK